MRKPILLIFAAILAAFSCLAQTNPVTLSAKVETVSGTEGVVVIEAKMAPSFHIYTTEPSDSYISTEINVAPQEGLELVGGPQPSRPAEEHYDATLRETLKYWSGTVTFRQKFRVTGPAREVPIVVSVMYQTCDENSCRPPKTETIDLSFQSKGAPAAAAASPAPVPAKEEPPLPDRPHNEADTAKAMPEAEEVIVEELETLAAGSDDGWWEPVEMEQKYSGAMPWYALFGLGFVFGLLALFTPCIWPMIPMTVSFFLKSSKNRSKGIANASIYGLSIVVIFVALGMLVSATMGPDSLNALATSAVFNVIFFILLVIFAISFLGAFEIKLPSKWANAMDSKAESTTGILSIFFMAFTLVLVSFSCTGPIVGTLLVEVAANGQFIGPLMGMLGFSVGLALPFTLFAIFPSFLSGMPKSGGWLNSVKVVLGFLELILALKFLSVADLAYGWGILNRHTFLSLWIVLFACLGFYLFGKLRFPHDSESKHTSVLGFMLGTCSLAFAVYLLPGLWGAPLTATSAFAPPMYTQEFYIANEADQAKNQQMEHPVFSDYEERMAYARRFGKPVLVDFTGYGCVNCRKMEVAVFDNPEG
ncbi:MAG: thiol:disulfide interchange protein, partial [Muribaculaceae bacterium]|nr:thiol:disulfide interchange protein [Muribaculaceae bacterium]